MTGRLDPGAISIVRAIKTPSQAEIDASTDVALFSDVEANYDIVQNGNGSITVTHARPDPAVPDDGIDTLWNIEIARFTDGDFLIGEVFNTPASGIVTLSSTTPVEGQSLTVSAVVNDPDGPASPALTFSWQREVDGDWDEHRHHRYPRSRRRTSASVSGCEWSSTSSTASVSPKRSPVIPRSLSST